MIALPFRITLQEPLLATSLEGDPNSATSYPFIPGSMIRGALATLYQSKHSVDIAIDETARRLFFEGATRFLNAYPLDRKERRTLPVPLAWVKEKEAEPPTKVYDWSCSAEETELKQPKRLKAPFCRLVGDVVELYTPQRRFSVHTQRDRRMGRATEDSGAIFRYEALARGQAFGAAILFGFDNEADVDALRSLLAQKVRALGGSRSAGYGLVSVKLDEPLDTWREVDASPADIPAGQPFTLTLLSDALIRETNGQYATFLTNKMLAGRLGVGEIKILDVFKQAGVIGGFNRKWGLPLPQTPVIRAGSVFVLEANEPISVEAISSLESRGIGYQRVEGLGRVAVNWHGRERELDLRKFEPEVTSEPPADLTGESLKLAQRMAKHLLDREVDGRLIDYVNTLDFKPRRIAPSQIAHLRVIVRSAQKDGDTQRVLDWLQDLKPTARKQFESARVRGAQLFEWLNDRLAAPSTVWAEIGLQQANVPAIGREQADLTEKLAREVTLRLVDGVLARAIKEVKGNE